MGVEHNILILLKIKKKHVEVCSKAMFAEMLEFGRNYCPYGYDVESAMKAKLLYYVCNNEMPIRFIL